MILWLIFAAMAVIAVAIVVLPLVRRPPGRAAPARADYDVAVYKDQLRDIERDRSRGVLGEDQAAAARIEVERRLLAATAAPETTAQSAPASPRHAPWSLVIVIALILLPGATLVYLEHGAPWLATAPVVAENEAAQAQFDALIAKLERTLKDRPDDRRGWVLLARGYARQGRMAQAQAAQQHALSLAENDTEAGEIAAGFGQVLVEEARGEVTPAAHAAFAEALKRNPKQPQARYFIGLAKIQAGDAKAALDDWRALLADTPADAPWRAGLQTQIAQLETEAAAPADPAARQAMIESMVAGLAQRLKESGGTAEEWARLGRSYAVLGRAAESRDAYAEAIKQSPDDTALLRDYAAAVAAADGEASDAHVAALKRLRDRLPEGSAERAAVEQRLKAQR
jgi:cytochrome c-type biogenesis protein CcmH